MSRDEILKALRTVMQDSSTEDVDWDNVSESATIEELGFDSLSILDLVYDIQQDLDVQFEAEELVNVRTVGELVTFLEEKTKA
jgi:acyl carrier protein